MADRARTRRVVPAVAAWSSAVMSLTACGDITEFSGKPAVPVVQILLVAGQPIQTADVQYSAPADFVVPQVARPIHPDSVALELIAPDGARTQFMPVAGAPTRFETNRLVSPGESYLLDGDIAGSHLSASVVIPGPLTIREPQQDTMHLAVSDATVWVDFDWSAPGAASYVVNHITPDGLISTSETIRETAGSLFIFSPFSQDTTRLEVWAYEGSATAFFRNPNGIVAAADGGPIVAFGAAVRAPTDKILVWQLP